MFDFIEPTALHFIWFLLLGVLLIGYAILDGFDLGVGILHPFIAKTPQERRIVMNSIGPLWDGNEVWLVTFGGALFAMFPEAYATVFSALYVPLVLLLAALIFRAVSLEFRGKVESATWRSIWDWSFFASSAAATLIFGVAVGVVLQGIPLDERGDSTATLLSFFTPFSLLTGLLALTAFALHGALFLEMKTEEALQARVQQVMWRCYGIFLTSYLFATIGTIALHEELLNNFRNYHVLWIVPTIHILVIANIPRTIHNRCYGQAFLMSCLNLACLVLIFGAELFPHMLKPTPGSVGMLASDAASSPATLRLGLIIVTIGMPIVLSYTAIIYWTFRGKVKLDNHSY